MPILNKKCILIIVLSTILRVSVAPFTGHPYDLNIWMETGQYVASGGSPYEPEIHLGYPPLWGLWCGLSYLLSDSAWPGNKFAYILFLKIPIIAADLMIAWMIVAFTLELARRSTHLTDEQLIQDTTSGVSPVTLFLFNPYILVVGVIWGMMDNIVALLSILTAIALTRRRYFGAGVAIGLAIALKLYPVILLFAVLPFLMKQPRCSVSNFFVGLALTGFLTVLAPFLLFNWDTAVFLSVLLDQGSRTPGGISPIAIPGLLYATGIHNIGSFAFKVVPNILALRYVWIPAAALAMVFIAKCRLQVSFENVIRAFSLVFAIWIITAPWVSEQNVEPLLVLMLFQGCAAIGRTEKSLYVAVSAAVLGFAFFNVPATEFLYQIHEIDATTLSRIGTYALPWIAMEFVLFVGIMALRIAASIRSGRTRN